MTASSNDKWSAYRQARYIRIIQHITQSSCDITVVEGHFAHDNEDILRGRIEKLTGKKFVFGFDPTDSSSIAGEPNTYGWFLTDYTTEVINEVEVINECVCGCEYCAHLTNISTNPEADPSYEELGCRQCDCTEYRAATEASVVLNEVR